MKNELPKGINEAISRVKSAKNLNPEIAKNILENIEISEEELMPWADFEHSIKDSYGRVMVYDGGFFELMVMSWNIGDVSGIHDHGFTEWGAVKLFGYAEHAVFKIDENDRMRTVERKLHEQNTVLPVGHDLIHQMGNPGFQKFLTLHLYGCKGREALVTGESKIYDFNEDKIQLTNGGVFFGLPESEIIGREPAPKPDFPTLARFKVEYLNRLFVTLYSEDNFECFSENLNKEIEEKIIYELFSKDFWEILRVESEEMIIVSKNELDAYLEILSHELAVVAVCHFNIMEIMEEVNYGNYKEKLESLLESMQVDYSKVYTKDFLELISEKFEIYFKIQYFF